MHIDAVWPQLDRTGLGNMLFPWARALVLSDAYQCDFIAPTWWRPRLGPYLRRERDKRQYQRDFVGKPLCSRLHDSCRLSLATIVDESEQVHRKGPITGRTILRTVGPADHFERLYQHRDFIRRNFYKLLRHDPPKSSSHYVALHVRLADFAKPDSSEGSRRNQSTEISWFVEQARSIAHLNPDIKFLLCSDGNPSDLSPLTGLPNLIRSTEKSPTSDLLNLARASLILGSGSTFSAWGAFLGDIPMLVEPGKNHYMRENTKVAEVSSVSSSLLNSIGFQQ